MANRPRKLHGYSNFNKGLLPPPRSASRVGGSPKYPFFNWELPDIHRCHYSCSTTQPMHLKTGASEHQYSSFSLHHYTKLSLAICDAKFYRFDIHMNKKPIEKEHEKFCMWNHHYYVARGYGKRSRKLHGYSNFNKGFLPLPCSTSRRSPIHVLTK